MTKWNKAQTLELINLYKQYPILYDIKSEEFLDHVKRNVVLSRITTSLKVLRPEVTQAEVRAKINKLRNQYLREKYALAKFQESRAENDEIYVPKLRFFNDLKFLDSCCFSNVVQPNDETGTETTDTASSIALDDKNVQRIIAIKQRKTTLDAQISRTLSLVEGINATMHSRTMKKPKPSPPHILGKMVATELEGIPENLFIDAKWKIMDIIKDTQKKHFRPKSSTSSVVTQVSYGSYEDSYSS